MTNIADMIIQQKLSIEKIKYSIPLEKIEEFRKNKVETFIAGQQRATEALVLGTKLRKTGYNIFVTGSTGTGRHTAIKKVLEDFETTTPLQDIVCVFNFKNPEAPGILYFPRGKAAGFKNSLTNLITVVKKRIRSRIESDNFKKKHNNIIKSYDAEEKELLYSFEKSLKDGGFLLVNSKTEDNEMISDIMPVIDEKPVDFDEIEHLWSDGKITEEKNEEIRSKYFKYLEDLQDLLRKMQHKRIEMENKLLEEEKKFVEPVINSEVEYLISNYQQSDVKKHLKELKKDILERLYLFIDDADAEGDSRGDGSVESDAPDLLGENINTAEWERYQISILVDNSQEKKAPVIFESYPTFSNLFGSIESRQEMGIELKNSFMMVKAGSMIKASGGFLVINAEDLFQEESAWEHLKRALKSGEVQIQQPVSPFNPTGGSLKPTPVKIDTKIIIVGTESLYDMLYNSDPEFEKFFKIIAEFDSEMAVTDKNTKDYINFIDKQMEAKNLHDITTEGVQAVLDYGIRLTGHSKRYSTRFSKIADLLVEADYRATEAGEKKINRLHVETALNRRNYLNSLPEEKLTEMIEEGTIRIDVKGCKTGVVNGLAVYDRGFYTFGRPFLISATAVPGTEGIINVEREAGLSGEIYNKCVMIIEGFLRSFYGRNFPLSMFASICFEQSYGEIEGDSASSTEIFALLSAIAEIPFRQDIAITGSVNQLGQIQPIGGVNEKIEGFYTICEKFGLTGTQGVIIPEANIKNLVLSKTLLEAIKEGNFSIYPIGTINQGLTILSGMEAGEADKKNHFPVGTFNKIVEKNLEKLFRKSHTGSLNFM